MKPWIHAKSSAKRWKGCAEDYLPIHQHLDSSKSSFSDSRHRLITHNSYYIGTVVELIFGVVAINSDGKEYSPRDVAELHVAEDFGGYIPTLDDWLCEVNPVPWMNGEKNSYPPSAQRIANRATTKTFVPFNKD